MTRINHRKMLKLAYLCLVLSADATFHMSDVALAQADSAFSDAYGTMIGPSAPPKVKGKDFFVTQQSNMANRGSTNAGVNPRGNVDVNPPGFIGDNPFGNSTVPNP